MKIRTFCLLLLLCNNSVFCFGDDAISASATEYTNAAKQNDNIVSSYDSTFTTFLNENYVLQNNETFRGYLNETNFNNWNTSPLNYWSLLKAVADALLRNSMDIQTKSLDDTFKVVINYFFFLGDWLHKLHFIYDHLDATLKNNFYNAVKSAPKHKSQLSQSLLSMASFAELLLSLPYAQIYKCFINISLFAAYYYASKLYSKHQINDYISTLPDNILPFKSTIINILNSSDSSQAFMSKIHHEGLRIKRNLDFGAEDNVRPYSIYRHRNFYLVDRNGYGYGGRYPSIMGGTGLEPIVLLGTIALGALLGFLIARAITTTAAGRSLTHAQSSTFWSDKDDNYFSRSEDKSFNFNLPKESEQEELYEFPDKLNQLWNLYKKGKNQCTKDYLRKELKHYTLESLTGVQSWSPLMLAFTGNALGVTEAGIMMDLAGENVLGDTQTFPYSLC